MRTRGEIGEGEWQMNANRRGNQLLSFKSHVECVLGMCSFRKTHKELVWFAHQRCGSRNAEGCACGSCRAVRRRRALQVLLKESLLCSFPRSWHPHPASSARGAATRVSPPGGESGSGMGRATGTAAAGARGPHMAGIRHIPVQLRILATVHSISKLPATIHTFLFTVYRPGFHSKKLPGFRPLDFHSLGANRPVYITAAGLPRP